MNVYAAEADDLGDETNSKDSSRMLDQRGDLESDAEEKKLEDHGRGNRVHVLEEERGKSRKNLTAMTLHDILLEMLRLRMRERLHQRSPEILYRQSIGLEETNSSLQEEVSEFRAEKALEAKQMDIQGLESRLQLFKQNKEIAQADLAALEERASLIDDTTIKAKGKVPQNAPQLGTEMRQSLQVGAQQLEEKNLDKLSERDCKLKEARADNARKDKVVAGLEHALSNLAKNVGYQDSCVMCLTKPNEGFTMETQLQTRQIEDFQTRIATALDSKNKAEQELDAARKRLEDSEEHFESQYLTCQLLQDRVDAVEAELQRCQAELQHCQAQISTLLHKRDELGLERENLHHSHSDVTRRVTDLEYRLAHREVAVKLQAVTLEDLMMKALSLVKQRDVESSSQHSRMCSIAEFPTGADSLLSKSLAIVPKVKNPRRPARQSSFRKGKRCDGCYGLGGDDDWVDEPSKRKINNFAQNASNFNKL